MLITEVGKSAEDRAQEVSEEEAETKAEADAMADEEAQNQAEEDHAVMSRRAQSHRQRQMQSRRKGRKGSRSRDWCRRAEGGRGECRGDGRGGGLRERSGPEIGPVFRAQNRPPKIVPPTVQRVLVRRCHLHEDG